MSVAGLWGAGLWGAAAIVSCGAGDAVVVGSKNFTEQNLLSEIVAQELEARGVEVERRFHLGGTFVCHRAIVGGEIDLYVEYSGTALTAILKEPPMQDAGAVNRTVAAAYRERWSLAWGPPLGFDNTFALVVRKGDADSLGLATISDLTAVAAGLTAAFGPEFMAREDGYPGLREKYGIDFGAVRQMDLGLMYRALAEGAVDVAVANSTDGQIAALDLVVLADDRRYFPPYEAAPVVRLDALDRWPAVGEALRALAGSLTEEEMRKLNREIDVEGGDVAAVARAWREKEG
ncbi:MAG TPA: glycine betaine ABC transporter substrate-binding protein [Gemmatimonadota bacterium]|nr:glycine betaine ABC transporter substrate-binding protein [Gemmatimonadota bacterium]